MAPRQAHLFSLPLLWEPLRVGREREESGRGAHDWFGGDLRGLCESSPGAPVLQKNLQNGACKNSTKNIDA
jgi:hypothetical protein